MNQALESRCWAAQQPPGSAAAALVAVVRHHGLPVTPASMRPFWGNLVPGGGLFELLITARRLGFEATPLEGDYDGLMEVPTPNVISLSRDDGAQDFAALLEIDSDAVVICDSATGKPVRKNRADFTASWTGDCVMIAPDAERFASMKETLERLADPWYRLRSALGLTPPFLPKALFVVIAVAVAVLAAGVQADSVALRWAIAALALALLTALWSWLFAISCQACSLAGALAGRLPVAEVGSCGYAILLGLALYSPESVGWTWGLFAAAGVHVGLVAVLAKARVLCWPCLLTALWVLLGAGALAGAAPRSLWMVAVAGLFAGITWIGIRRAPKTYRLLARSEALELAGTVIREPGESPPGRSRLVVYKRRNCPRCMFYESVLRPAIEEEFGDRVRIEERDGGRRRIPVPLFILQGVFDAVLFDLPEESAWETLGTALRKAGDPALAPLRDLEGLHVIAGARFI